LVKSPVSGKPATSRLLSGRTSPTTGRGRNPGHEGGHGCVSRGSFGRAREHAAIAALTSGIERRDCDSMFFLEISID
jgi:hypothetical protein